MHYLNYRTCFKITFASQLHVGPRSESRDFFLTSHVEVQCGGKLCKVIQLNPIIFVELVNKTSFTTKEETARRR